MKTFTLFLVCISTCFLSYSQEKPKDTAKSIAKNTLFVECGGNSIVLGVNYDRILINKEKWKFTGRVGVLYSFFNEHSTFGVPHEVTFLIGKHKHFFETGPGVTYYYEFPHSGYSVYLFSRFGYRYQQPQGGFFLKAGINVVGPLTKNSDLFSYSEFHWLYGGVGVGYTFKPRQ